jgi:hypothetical protein
LVRVIARVIYATHGLIQCLGTKRGKDTGMTLRDEIAKEIELEAWCDGVDYAQAANRIITLFAAHLQSDGVAKVFACATMKSQGGHTATNVYGDIFVDAHIVSVTDGMKAVAESLTPPTEGE